MKGDSGADSACEGMEEAGMGVMGIDFTSSSVGVAADFGSVGICGDFARSPRASSACVSDATTTQT